MNIRTLVFSSPLYVMLLIVLLVGCKSSSSYRDDPVYQDGMRAMASNYQLATRMVEAYTTVQNERVKAGRISQKEANALVQLKRAEVAADMDKANQAIEDRYLRSKSSERSLTCMTTSSYNSAFTTCN